MYYKKTEEYKFAIPREFKACLAFKQRLKDMGIKYIDEGGNTMAVITVHTNGSFDVDDQCDILALVKNEE